MSDIVIQAEHLGKRYMIGHKANHEPYKSVRDVIANGFKALARSVVSARERTEVSRDELEEFWALKDVNFEIKRGEVVGIIGRNGAGKSTLLKILSRITEPSEGRVILKGRIASLLEVGTGFHPELSGSDNIYLNGAILGMTRAEIKSKFDEIVAFAEVEKFLDTPVKRYSSGMYVRLAFAVAAHLEPEILVVDEVLAVGDAEFQKKCLGKMSDVAKGGRTILFVSHNIAAIETLCPRSIHLASGSLVGDAETYRIVQGYLQSRSTSAQNTRAKERRIDDELVLEGISHSPATIRCGDSAEFEMEFRAETAGQIRECAVLIHSAKGQRAAVVDLRESAAVPHQHDAGRFTIILRIASLPLVEGDYSVGLYLVTKHFEGNILDLDDFTIFRSRQLDFAPYKADLRGIVVLNATAFIAVDEPERAAR